VGKEIQKILDEGKTPLLRERLLEMQKLAYTFEVSQSKKLNVDYVGRISGVLTPATNVSYTSGGPKERTGAAAGGGASGGAAAAGGGEGGGGGGGDVPVMTLSLDDLLDQEDDDGRRRGGREGGGPDSLSSPLLSGSPERVDRCMEKAE
jgi:hypothetical protein